MANFAAVEDIENFLQIEISDADKIAAAEWHLSEASAAVRNYTKQFLELVTGETITRDCRGGWRFYLPELPVIEVLEVVEDGITLTADEDYKLGDHGILHRIGRIWKRGIQILEFTYTHGFATIPDDIIGVTTRAAARGYQAGLKAASEAGVPGVASKSLGDYSVSYVTDSSEGLMGASAARMLLLSEKDILDHYRLDGP